LLDRLHANCAVLAAEWGSDVVALGRHVRGVEPVGVEVRKELVSGTGDAPLVRIAIEGRGQRLRLDRLLAGELGRSRSCIARWQDEGALAAVPAQRFVQDGQQVRLSLTSLSAAERQAIIRAATGEP
jgi:hypothetical protein